MTIQWSEASVLATGLRFPEGPAVTADGSLLVPEIESGTVSLIGPDGVREVFAECGGGANGSAFGPDGALYVCNDGGLEFAAEHGLRFPTGRSAHGGPGLLQRIDIDTRSVVTALPGCDGRAFGTLNDIVFDEHGWCYFVDTTHGVIYYADPIAGVVRPAAEGLAMPNGAGLSPDGTSLYVSETRTGRILRWPIRGAGQLDAVELFYLDPEAKGWDGLAVDGNGNICVASLGRSAVTVLDPAGGLRGRYVTPTHDAYITNLCFGGPSGHTAFICSGGLGLVYALDWPWPGLKLNFQPEAAAAL